MEGEDGLDVLILRTLRAIKSGDGRVYDKTATFFGRDDDEDGGDDGRNGGQRNKPKRYRDVAREQILEQRRDEEAAEGKEARLDENCVKKNGEDDVVENNNLAYDAEQREIRLAILESTRDEDAGNNDKAGDCEDEREKGIDDDDEDEEDWTKNPPSIAQPE